MACPRANQVVGRGKRRLGSLMARRLAGLSNLTRVRRGLLEHAVPRLAGPCSDAPRGRPCLCQPCHFLAHFRQANAGEAQRLRSRRHRGTGSTLSAILLQESVALSEGAVALALLILMQFIVTSLSVRYPSFAEAVRSEPSLLVRNGQFCWDAMRRERITGGNVKCDPGRWRACGRGGDIRHSGKRWDAQRFFAVNDRWQT